MHQNAFSQAIIQSNIDQERTVATRFFLLAGKFGVADFAQTTCGTSIFNCIANFLHKLQVQVRKYGGVLQLDGATTCRKIPTTKLLAAPTPSGIS